MERERDIKRVVEELLGNSLPNKENEPLSQRKKAHMVLSFDGRHKEEDVGLILCMTATQENDHCCVGKHFLGATTLNEMMTLYTSLVTSAIPELRQRITERLEQENPAAVAILRLLEEI